jgi:hypothetical protein
MGRPKLLRKTRQPLFLADIRRNLEPELDRQFVVLGGNSTVAKLLLGSGTLRSGFRQRGKSYPGILRLGCAARLCSLDVGRHLALFPVGHNSLLPEQDIRR